MSECVKHTWPYWAARRAMQPRVMSYTPDELPHVTRTSCLTAARLEGPAPCDCPFRLPSLFLQQSTGLVTVSPLSMKSHGRSQSLNLPAYCCWVSRLKDVYLNGNMSRTSSCRGNDSTWEEGSAISCEHAIKVAHWFASWFKQVYMHHDITTPTGALRFTLS